MKEVHIDPKRLRSWKGFHDAFAEAIDFPTYYGRNLDAWRDCLWDAMGESILLDLGDCRSLQKKRPDILKTLEECVEGLIAIGKRA